MHNTIIINSEYKIQMYKNPLQPKTIVAGDLCRNNTDIQSRYLCPNVKFIPKFTLNFAWLIGIK